MMGEEAEFFNAFKADRKAKFDADRKSFMEAAKKADDGGWTRHTEFHWSRMINGERLDYWPSRKKFQFRGKVRRGSVQKFIKKLEVIE